MNTEDRRFLAGGLPRAAASLRTLGALVICLLMAHAVVEGQAPLFTEVSAETGNASPSVRRQRKVRIALDLIENVNLGDSLTFNLFNDINLTGVFQRIERRSPSRYTWSGQIRVEGGGNFTLVVEDGVVVADVLTTTRRSYHIRYAGNAVNVIREIDTTRLPERRTGPERSVSFQEHSAETASANQMRGMGAQIRGGGADHGSVIDVLVLYTPAARDAQGGYGRDTRSEPDGS